MRLCALPFAMLLGALASASDACAQAALNRDLGPILSLTGQGAGTVNSKDQQNAYAHALKCVVAVATISGTGPTLTVTIQGKDGATGSYYTLLQSAALNSVAATVLTVGPGLTAATNTVANDFLPFLWRVTATVAGTSPSVTATVGCSLIG